MIAQQEILVAPTGREPGAFFLDLPFFLALAPSTRVGLHDVA